MGRRTGRRLGLAAGSAAVVVGQMADTATCAVMVSLHGVAAEANPLAQALLIHGGLELLVMAKVALIAFAIATIVAANHRDTAAAAVVALAARAAAAVVALAALGAGLFGAYTNIASW